MRGVPALAAALAAAVAAQVGAQTPDGLAEDRLLAVATVRAIQDRTGTALWGGSPVPGTASTLGLRLGSTPRVSLSSRLALVPTALPPLLDATQDRGRRTTLYGMSGQATVGVLNGWSPAPTVGGVLSMDVIGRVSFVPMPAGAGFRSGTAAGWSAGVRVGALRESFTTPGVSLTAEYGRSSRITLGDPELADTDGFARAAISDLSATLAASQRIGALRLTGGLATDRYTSDARVGYRGRASGQTVNEQMRVTGTRRSWFANASWTHLVFHASTELGWQSLPEPPALPPAVRVRPVGWWAALAFRVSI